MDKAIIHQDFYVYLHRKSTTNEVFYVGKGHGRRAWTKSGRSKLWKNTEKKHGFIVEIAYSGLKEWASLEIECDLIAMYGRKDLGLGQLVNYTDGGEGVCGLVHMQKAKEAVRLANLGHTRNRGRILSDDHKEKIKAHLYGNQYTKGKKLTEEHKRKVKETLSKNGWPNSKKVIHIESGIIFRSCADAIRWLKKEKNIIAAPMTFSQNLKKSRAVFGELFSAI